MTALEIEVEREMNPLEIDVESEATWLDAADEITTTDESSVEIVLAVTEDWVASVEDRLVTDEVRAVSELAVVVD